jgi:hypothetical protein
MHTKSLATLKHQVIAFQVLNLYNTYLVLRIGVIQVLYSKFLSLVFNAQK